MTELPKKNYYRLTELAAEWGCTVEDVVHHFLHDRIRIGVPVHDETLYGLDAQLHTLGIYSVSGVLTIPSALSEKWEFGAIGIIHASGWIPERDYWPEIVAASYMDPDSLPAPFSTWARGCDWEHPATDHWLIERFVAGVIDCNEVAPRDRSPRRCWLFTRPSASGLSASTR